MCLYILSSWTLQDTSILWHLLLGGRLINTTAEYITVGMCVMFGQKIQIWFQRDFRRLLASNIFLKGAVNFRIRRHSHWGISLQEIFWGRLSRNESLSESTAEMSFCPASGTHYKWYASATHPLRHWRSATVVTWCRCTIKGRDTCVKDLMRTKYASGLCFKHFMGFRISKWSLLNFFLDWCFWVVHMDMIDMQRRKMSKSNSFTDVHHFTYAPFGYGNFLKTV